MSSWTRLFVTTAVLCHPTCAPPRARRRSSSLSLSNAYPRRARQAPLRLYNNMVRNAYAHCSRHGEGESRAVRVAKARGFAAGALVAFGRRRQPITVAPAGGEASELYQEKSRLFLVKVSPSAAACGGCGAQWRAGAHVRRTARRMRRPNFAPCVPFASSTFSPFGYHSPQAAGSSQRPH